MGPPPAPGLAALGTNDAAVYAFAATLQGVVATGMGASLPSPPPLALAGRVTAHSLLHLRVACGGAGYGGLPPIWEKVARIKGCTKGLSTLNQVLRRCLLSCWKVFGGRAQFSTSLPILAFIRTSF